MQFRLLRILRPKKHVALIAFRYRHELAQLLFVSLGQFQNRQLHPLTFALVRFNAVSVEQLKHASVRALWKTFLNNCNNLVA